MMRGDDDQDADEGSFSFFGGSMPVAVSTSTASKGDSCASELFVVSDDDGGVGPMPFHSSSSARDDNRWDDLFTDGWDEHATPVYHSDRE